MTIHVAWALRPGHSEEILLGLLDSGRVSKEEIEVLYQKVLSRLDSEK